MSQHQHLTSLLLLLLLTVTIRGAVVDSSDAFNSPRGKYHPVTVPSTDRSEVDVKLVTPQSETGGRIQPPDPPVVFVHYDYMAAPSWDPSAGNFAPDAAAIERVVEAFRRHGITLVIDHQHTEIPYHQWMFFGPTGPIFGGPPCVPAVCVNFFDLKDQYFQPKGRQPWHYVIFGDRGYNPEVGLVGGQAELPGYSFMVTAPSPHRTCFFGTQLDLCQDLVSGLFMHELGHNFGLRHGGDVGENYKLNYVSVMNYLYQRGIMYAAPGDTFQFGTWFLNPPVTELAHIAGIRLDYSDRELPTLDESHLDERVGLGGPASDTDVTFYFACQAQLLLPCKSGYIRVAAAPFDWDNNGTIEPDAAADINYIENFGGDLVLTTMHGYNDWKHVQEFLRTPRYAAGTLRPVEIVADPLTPDPGPVPRP